MYIFGRFYTEKKERLMWKHLFVCDLVSAINPFVRSSRNSVHQHYIKICRISVRFLQISWLTFTFYIWYLLVCLLEIPYVNFGISWFVFLKFHVYVLVFLGLFATNSTCLFSTEQKLKFAQHVRALTSVYDSLTKLSIFWTLPIVQILIVRR